jgi:hypothetical protein
MIKPMRRFLVGGSCLHVFDPSAEPVDIIHEHLE